MATVPKSIDAAGDIAALAKKKVGGRKRPGRGDPRAKGGGVSAGPAMGEGYGGPAKGVGAGPEGLIGARTPERIADKAATRERMKAIMEEIATNDAVHPMVRLAAADKLLDRLEGKAVNTNLNLDGDDIDRLSDAELRAEAERLGNQIADAQARAHATTPEPGSLPH